MRSSVITQRNYPEEVLQYGQHMEMPKGDSLTVPNQTLSLRDLLERYVMSGTTEVFPATYTGMEENILPDDIEKLDPFQRRDLAAQLGEYIAEGQQKIIEANEKKKVTSPAESKPDEQANPATSP